MLHNFSNFGNSKISIIERIYNKIENKLTFYYPSLRYRLRYIKKLILKKEKISIIDVGSYGGFLDNWKKNDIERTLSFDPIDNRNSNSNDIVYKSVLWGENKLIDLFYTRGGGTDTLRHDIEYINLNKKNLERRLNSKPIEQFIKKIQVIKTEKIEARTLDSVLNELKIGFDFLKIDVQGAEKQVLIGAKEFIASDKCLGIFIEIYTVKMFIEQWTLNQVIDYLKKLNFSLVLLYPSHGSFGCSNDALFIKNGIKSPKINTILNTYNLLRWSDGFYESEININQ